MAKAQNTQADEPAMADTGHDEDAVEAHEATTVEPEVESEPEAVIESDHEPAAEPDASAAPSREVIFVDAPTPPRKRGNRGFSALLAIPATLIFLGLLIAIQYVISGGDLDFLREPSFYFPALFLFLGLVLIGLVLNRSGWWSHVFGSVVVGAIVWFGSASLALVAAGMLSMTQPQANEFFYAELFSATSIIAALLAREVAMWTGAALARRGRALKVRNADAHAAYEKEQADLLNTGR